MKTFFNKHGLITALVLIIAVIFVGGGFYSNFMTNQIAVHEEENKGGELNALFLSMFTGATNVEEFETTAVTKSYFKPLSNSEEYTPVLTGSYKVLNGSSEIGVIYVVTTFGKNANLTVAYGIDLASDSLTQIKVISNEETPTYFANLSTNFYIQFVNKSLDDIGFSIDSVAGATMSSKGIETGMFYAREQYAADFDFTIPSIVMTLNSLTYNLDPATFATKPFIADVTYGDENTNVVVYLDSSFTYAGIVTGTEPASDVQSGIKSYASASGQVVTSASFVSYDAGTRTLVLISKGYNNTPIQGTYVLNATLDGVESYSFITSESYDNEYNGGYNHLLGVVPYVENNLSEQFKNGEVEIDAIAGATVTSNAMKNMINLVKLFIADQNGGE
jgi:Na+-translocating ferredoxin:NAD+ oxidoreductase RnfG subunit